MGLLDDIIASDSAVFVDTDGFGEAVTYLPRVGGTRSINAVVERTPPQPGPSQLGTLIPMMRVHVRNDSTNGIASSEWSNGDKLRVAERRGGSTKDYQIHWPSNAGMPDAQHDAGMVTFELR